MSTSRIARALTTVALVVALAVGAWLGLQHLMADGLSPIDAAMVGLATFVLATVVGFSRL